MLSARAARRADTAILAGLWAAADTARLAGIRAALGLEADDAIAEAEQEIGARLADPTGFAHSWAGPRVDGARLNSLPVLGNYRITAPRAPVAC